MAKTVNARTLPVQSIGYKYGKLIIPPYEVDVEFTPQEEAALDSGITADMIPSAAGANNQLADKQYVDDNIASASATFRGNYNQVTDLNLTVSASHSDVEAALANVISTVDKNDYCYVDIPTSDQTPTQIAKTERYKFDGTAWNYEYSPTPIDKPACKPFNGDWPTNTTLAAFCAAVVADTDSVIGQVYLGQLSCSGLPDGMGNGEAKVEVTQGLSGKALVITMTSTNLSPYHWEQTYYNSTLYGWKSWVPSEDLPEVHDYTSWNSAGTTQGGAGAMVVANETGYKAILALTNSYTISNMPVGNEMYIPANAVLDGNTLITVYNDPALTDDSGIKVKIGAERKSTIDEALSLIYFASRNEAEKYTDEEIAVESYNQKNFSAIMSLATDPNAGVTSVTTNPEWKMVLTDNEDRILIGKRQDNTWYQATDLDTILDTIINGYSTS